jgi:flagellar assembly protein FliH
MKSSTDRPTGALPLETFRRAAPPPPRVRREGSASARTEPAARPAEGAQRAGAGGATEAAIGAMRERLVAEHAAELEALRAAHTKEMAALERNMGEEIEGTGAAFREATARLAAESEAWRVHAERHLTAVALAAAARLLHRQLELEPDAVAGVVRHALAVAGPMDVALRLYVAPADAEVVEGMVGEQALISVVADPAVLRGGCRLERADRVVDVTLPALLEAMLAEAAHE